MHTSSSNHMEGENKGIFNYESAKENDLVLLVVLAHFLLQTHNHNTLLFYYARISKESKK